MTQTLEKRTERKSLNWRNVLQGMLIAVATLFPGDAYPQVRTLPNGQKIAVDGDDYIKEHWEDIHPKHRDKVLEIECDGETAVYHNDGSARESTIPYVSLGNENNNYMLTFAVPPGRKLSVNITKESKFGGLETKYGDLTFALRDYASVNIQDQSRIKDQSGRDLAPLVPLVKTVGLVEIVSDKSFVGVGDENKDGQLEVDFVHYFTAPEKFSPPFHFCPYDKKMKPIKQGESYFADYYGKIWKVNEANLVFHNRRPVTVYHVNRENNGGIYIPTLAFAALKNKEKFWRNTSHLKQVELGNAPLDVLKEYAR